MQEIDLDKIVIGYSSFFETTGNSFILTFDELIKYMILKDCEVYYSPIDIGVNRQKLHEMENFLLKYEEEIPKDMQKYLFYMLYIIFYTRIETLTGKPLKSIPIKEWKNLKYLIVNEGEQIRDSLYTLVLYYQRGLL